MDPGTKLQNRRSRERVVFFLVFCSLLFLLCVRVCVSVCLLLCLRDRFMFVAGGSTSRKDKLVRTSNRDPVNYNQTKCYLILSLVVDSQEPICMDGPRTHHQAAACSAKIHFYWAKKISKKREKKMRGKPSRRKKKWKFRYIYI